MVKHSFNQKNGNKERLLDLEKIWAIMRKNWIVLKNDRTRILAMLFFPVVMITLFGFTSGVSPKHLSAVLVDYDQSPLSQDVTLQLQALETISIQRQFGTESEAKILMDQGGAKVIVVIPAGFGEAVAHQKPALIRLLVDESDPSVAQIAKQSVYAFVQKISAQLGLENMRTLQIQSTYAKNQLAVSQGLMVAASNSPSEKSLSLSLQALTNAQSRLLLLQKSVASTTSALLLSLDNPANPDLLNSPELRGSITLGSGASSGLVTSILRDQQTLGQIAAYNILGAYGFFAYKQAAIAQTQTLKLSALRDAQSAQLYLAKQNTDLAANTLDTISTVDAGVLTNPISLMEVPAYGQNRQGIDFLLPNLLALIIFQGAVMGMGRSIAGERKDGSLTRVFLTPTSNTTILVGTQLFFIVFETIRSTFIVFLAILLFGVNISGNLFEILLIILLFATGSIGVGLFLSTLAKSEEQYQPMAMLVSLPMLFLAGVFFPIQTMPAPIQAVAQAIPIQYAGNALRGVMIKGFSIFQVLPDVVYLIAFAAITFAISLAVFQREVI